MLTTPAAIFVKRHVGQSGSHDEVFHDDEHVVRTLTKILDDAAGAHRKLDPTEGLHLVFTEDYTFSSPSQAAMVALGRTSNGRVEWKT